MLAVKFICVGRLKEKYFADAFAEYKKRLAPFCRFEVEEIRERRLPERPSSAELDAALRREAGEIMAAVPAGAYLTAMCPEGEAMSSEAFAALLRERETDGGKPCFVTGGSFGLHEDVKKAAKLRLSMSAMTFPHHLARVMLIEQLYRAATINGGIKYHK